jgi:hypothetical protein
VAKIQVQFTDGRTIETLRVDAAKHDAGDAAFMTRTMAKRGFRPLASSVLMIGRPVDAQPRNPLGFAQSALFTRKRTAVMLRGR